MPKIFISYRRADSLKDSGRIYDRMVQAFGKRNVFKDMDDIPSGSDFRKVIITEISRCDVVLVIIGRGWLNAVDEEGSRRLDNSADFVRIEVETALRRQDISVIPVLVDNARMPRESELPVTLRELAFKNAAVVRDDPDFHRDVTRLIEGLKGAQRTTLIPPAPRRQFGRIGAGLVILLLAVAGMIFLPGILEDNGQQATQEVTEVGEAATETQTSTTAPTDEPSETPLTPTAFPTDTPAPTLSERDRAIQLALAGVDSNDEWIPYIEEINGVEMVLVPKGCFMMGSTDEQIDYALELYGEGGEREWFADEQPAHLQCFDEPFWMDRYEVSNAQFREFNGQAGRESAWTGDNRPRERITWLEARDFCESRGARLPTEREWEYAARGPDNLIYPWGNEFVAENVEYRDNSGGQTAVVGSRPEGASWVGALDMSGHVWEWVNSLYYENYPYSEDLESNSDTNSVRGLRGGSWGSNGSHVRAASRSGYDPDDEGNGIGFRCVLSYQGG